MNILGISGNFYRASADPAAVLIKNGEIVAAAEEERFIRVKHAFSQMPEHAIRFCLRKGGISIEEVDVLAFPQVTWRDIEKNLGDFFDCNFGGRPKSVEFIDHHLAHAASAYRLSGFDEAIILTADWSGDGVATTLSAGERGQIRMLKRLPVPHNSLGIYYGLITQYLGFKKWEDEYKVMGLASYGKPSIDLSWLLGESTNGDLFHLDTQYLHETITTGYPAMHGLQQPSFSKAFVEKVGPPRIAGTQITEHHKAIAASAQRRLEEIAMILVRKLHEETGFRNLCIAGGVGLNCSLNGELLNMECVDALFVPPVANDSGIALGAAVEVAAQHGFRLSKLTHASFGPEYSAEEIRKVLDRSKLKYQEGVDVVGYVAKALTENKIVGWFQGAMEFGPRALGNRSILADPRQPDMRDRINYYVKFREDFRPLAPSIIQEAASEYFVGGGHSPFMTVTFPVRKEKRKVIPAVTHVDGTSRVQTVTRESNPRYYELIKRFGEMTNVPVVLNTSLNVMGDPIALRPEHAVSTFFSSGLDCLAIGDFVISKQ